MEEGAVLAVVDIEEFQSEIDNKKAEITLYSLRIRNVLLLLSHLQYTRLTPQFPHSAS